MSYLCCADLALDGYWVCEILYGPRVEPSLEVSKLLAVFTLLHGMVDMVQDVLAGRQCHLQTFDFFSLRCKQSTPVRLTYRNVCSNVLPIFFLKSYVTSKPSAHEARGTGTAMLSLLDAQTTPPPLPNTRFPLNIKNRNSQTFPVLGNSPDHLSQNYIFG